MKIGFIKNFIACITTKYFKFSGRASRQEYWKFVAILILSSFVLSVLQVLFMYTSLMKVIRLIETLWSLFLIIPHWAVAVRRLHDTNKTGWMLLLPFGLGVIGFLLAFMFNNLVALAALLYLLTAIYLFYLFVKRGTIGANQYGEDPYKSKDIEAVFEEKMTIEDDIIEE